MVKVVIKSLENGPNLVTVDDKLICKLCRCGQSNNKPYCDSTHNKVAFKASAVEINITE